MGSKVIAGRYELLEKIGDGGMAVVYKAKCRLLNRLVALKILKPEFTKDEKFIENFRKESHAAASFSNPNIVNIYDVGREGNINYIVMELVDGRPLSDIINEEAPFPYERVIELTKQIAMGLSAAHKHGIIHRDIKPHNILIGSNGIAKITDFGIAKAMSKTTVVDVTNEAIMGSVHYFSPEQARGNYVDEKSDIYSLGIVMYEMLTGNVPYDGDSPVSVAMQHVSGQIESPSSVTSGIPPALDKIVLKATDKIQTNRYASADDLIDALDNIEFVSRMVGRSTFVMSRESMAEKAAAAEKAEINGENDRESKKRSNLYLDDKKRRGILIAAICILAIGALIAVAMATGLLGKSDVKVPDVRGLEYEKAKETLKEAGFSIKKGDDIYSDKYKKGQIAAQDPGENTSVKKGATVTVDISRGPSDGTVPNLVGMTKNEAKKRIQQHGFKMGEVTIVESSEEKDRVLKQSPEGGTDVKSGSAISIVVSNGEGKKKADVPDLRGMTKAAAENAIKGAGFTVGNITYDVSTTYAKDKVMKQEYEGGSSLAEGTAIGFTISKGGSVPININIDYSAAKQEVFYMTVTVSDSDGTRNIVFNEQRKKSSGSENITINGKGSGSVKITFDNVVIYSKNANFSTGELN